MPEHSFAAISRQPAVFQTPTAEVTGCRFWGAGSILPWCK